MNRSIRQDNGKSYNYIESQLQKQTQILLAQRRALEAGYAIPPQKRSSVNHVNASENNFINGRNKMNRAINQIKDILKLARQDANSFTGQELREIQKVQKAVLNLMEASQSSPGKSKKNNKQTRKSQRQSQRQSPQKAQHFNTFSKIQSGRLNIEINEDAIQMIAQIQRKALNQILNLQQQRDALLNQRQQLKAQLNGRPLQHGAVDVAALINENKLLKEQNENLCVRLQTLGHMQNYYHYDKNKNNINLRQNLQNGQYDNQIAVYQNQLNRASAIIRQLKVRLQNVPGLQQLHNQGQRIRRQTTQLLQIKRGNNNGNSNQNYKDNLIAQLQEKLQQEQRNKNQFLIQVKQFKKKYIQLQNQNAILKKSKQGNQQSRIYRKQSPLYQKNNYSKKTNDNFSDYQRILNEARKTTY